ncbi:MAG: class I poly(R)-hydroxyalkanoic acid synthase, partial [Pseudomonadota bacterium]
MTERSRNVVQDVIDQQAKRGRSGGAWPFDPLNVGNAFLTIAKEFANDPGRAYEAQLDLWKEHVALWENAARRIVGQEPEPVAEPARGDKRFRHKAWTDSHVLDYLKQAYLITSKWMQDTVGGLDGLDPKEKKKIDFYTKQFADALSPTNFALTNPEVIEETLESRGENLLRGLRNLLADLDRGDGELIIRQTDLDYFKVGENVATAPGKVIYQNRVMQLIQYAPTTDKVYKRPLLIFPPWINKFYILDLREENSFIRWMTDQGHTVFLVSWVNPDPSLAELTFRDYAKEGVFAALDAIEKATGEREVNAIGYCIGGTLLSCSLAHMAETGDERIKSATYFAAQTDFSEAGDLLVFIDEKQLQNLEKQMEVSGGVLEGTSMAAAFNMLRANDLIWSFVINNYLMGKDPKRFDLLYWNSDATRMPKRLQIDYLREFYMYNKLSRGEFALFDKTLSMKKVKIPVYMQASETDHIAPCVWVFKGAKLLGGPVRFMVAGSGHIAGVINHPDAKKYQHWT